MADQIKRELKAAIEARVKKGETVRGIAEEAGVAHSQVSRFLAGERTLTLPAIEKLCKVLGLHLSKQDDARQS